MKITKEKLLELKSILGSTPLMGNSELKLLKLRAPGIYYSNRAYNMDTIKYTLNHTPLNNFISEITNWDSTYLTSIHKIEYTKGSKVREHVDDSDLTCVIMLENNSEGGDFLFNKKKIEFKEEGEYLLYNGGKTYHEVTELISGNRNVLVIWYRMDTTNTKSIL